MLRFASSLGRLGFTCNDKLYICHPAHVLPGVVRHCPRVGRPLIHPKSHRLGCAAASPVLAPTRLTRSHDSKVPLDHRFNLADTVSAVADDVFLLVLPPDSQGKVGDSAPLWSPLANEKLRVLSL